MQLQYLGTVVSFCSSAVFLNVLCVQACVSQRSDVLLNLLMVQR